MPRKGLRSLEIGGRRIGAGAPLFVIAEIGLNHGGSLDRALAMVDAAAEAGASAVKLQTLIATELVAPSCPVPAHLSAASLLEFFERFELDEAAHRAIAARARQRGLAFLSTPLSLGAVDLLERVGVDAYKIASGDITWRGLISACAATGKPLVISTGMAGAGEVAAALWGARLGGASAAALMHCVSAYPVPPGQENLRTIELLADMFGVPTGLSDHAPDTSAVAVAVALGADLYERHLVLDRSGAVDDAVSSTPDQFAALVRTAARTQQALGNGQKRCGTAESRNVQASRRALCAARDLPAGTVVQGSDVIALRPGNGLVPDRLEHLLGVRLVRAIPAGSPFLEADLAGTYLLEGIDAVA
ncbi:MAG: N-acetylneuraminate synthase family protein [Acidobacteria bacterium]|nr:N-acetylneuraminate synthase family protein [Acidobacteriota bacterium]